MVPCGMRFAGWRSGAVQWGGGSLMWHLFQRLPRRPHGWFSCHLVLKSLRKMWAIQTLIARGTGPVFLKDVSHPTEMTKPCETVSTFT